MIIYLVIFLLPLATVIALSVLYWNELGARKILVYLPLCLLVFFGAPAVGIPPYASVAIQALLAVIMLIHVKAKTF